MTPPAPAPAIIALAGDLLVSAMAGQLGRDLQPEALVHRCLTTAREFYDQADQLAAQHRAPRPSH